MEFKIGDWVIYDRKINQVRKSSYSDNLELTDGHICTSCGTWENARPLTIRNKAIADTFEIYYERLRKMDGSGGFNFPDINRYFTNLCIEAMDANDADTEALFKRANEFTRQARDYTKVIDGVRLFRSAA